jgi:hypothetical protein
LDVDDLIASIGSDRYRCAQEWAWATAATTGTSAGRSEPKFPRDCVNVPQDLGNMIWYEPGLGRGKRMDTTFALYRDMPCYALLMYLQMHFGDLDSDEKAKMWKEYRALLSHPDGRLAGPITYSLWCNYFEDRATVAEAWRELTPPTVGPQGISRLLRAAGPVPYELKEPLYLRLVPQRRWHSDIFESLWASRFDIFGNIDRPKARKLLDRLYGVPNKENVARLRAELG